MSSHAGTNEEQVDKELTEEEQMAKLLGFAGFASTHGQQIESNVTTAARGGRFKVPGRKFRQYMNRRDGFNRPVMGSGTADR